MAVRRNGPADELIQVRFESAIDCKSIHGLDGEKSPHEFEAWEPARKRSSKPAL
jgi:hypothetical protein